MSVTKAVVFQKGEKVRPHFKNRRALGVGLALVFGTVGECGSATLSRGEMVESCLFTYHPNPPTVAHSVPDVSLGGYAS